MKQKITLLDGAQGTRLWTLASEAGVPRDPVWTYNITHPDFVAQMHREYLDAGAEIIAANTFGANRPSLERHPGYTVEQVVREAVAIAKDAAAGYGTKVALDIGPLPVLLKPYGTLSAEEAGEIFAEVLQSGTAAGAELILFETFMDLEMLRIAAEAASKYSLPVICSMSFEKKGRTMMGNRVSDVVKTLSPLGPAGIGMNCSLGPELALPVIRQFAEQTDLPLFFKPNAGMPTHLPDGTDVYDCPPERFVEEIAPALELVSYLGGCCGTDADYIRALKAAI